MTAQFDRFSPAISAQISPADATIAHSRRAPRRGLAVEAAMQRDDTAALDAIVRR